MMNKKNGKWTAEDYKFDCSKCGKKGIDYRFAFHVCDKKQKKPWWTD